MKKGMTLMSIPVDEAIMSEKLDFAEEAYVTVKEQRRERLIELQRQADVSCEDLGHALDRHPDVVRMWRRGECGVPDHTLALLELAVRHGYL